ncbi:hypothetical protein TREMEDRAFT_63976 [Tremella mesenterica DSM 1558]|uniref:uncharacterized protein n=1 Tax=Tremella mesenterica (strain ATCC 24925 / CBS 8224 / DSM 1558 / NBRC 9311 / NRRL Y-6157 / RJB 2259-6 / UBC 559-6) TaxID=578456 RepID=UPI0003F4A186|nr:uncharacterized protein TREMEDRAFT_63976 [Tremella mesenterica DSM 1558]EIW68085.1 hypothetical protein TREMEDRAFT_63976 [Tremella mesenterica DSM 1558]
MSRSVQTVQELWQEYLFGINGRPSIKSQYEDNPNGLKNASETEKRFYRRRISIIRAVRRLGETRAIEDVEAAKIWDKHRHTLPNPSLDALQHWLSKASAEELISV